MKRILWILLSSALAIHAQTVTSIEVTPTQAVMRYSAPSASACSLQVSESATLSPLVHDIDSTLFVGANSDNRMGNTSVGSHRTFVIGTRRADVASDGNLHSRALQANTTHYYSLTCPGASTATGQFTTTNPPLGNTYPEPLPFNAAALGNYGWPTINWNDQTQVYVDPLTGIAIKRLVHPAITMVSRAVSATTRQANSVSTTTSIMRGQTPARL
jgi:hypothetical protein